MRATFSPGDGARANASEIMDLLHRTSARVSELGLAPGLDPELDFASELASTLARDLGLARDLARDLGLGLGPDLGIGSACDLARALVRDFAHSLDFARGLDCAPDRELSLVLLASQLRCDLQKLIEMMTSAHGRVTQLRAVFFAEAKSREGASAESRSRTAVSAETKDTRQAPERAYVAVARPAARVATWSVQILPQACRPRYEMEFGSELYDLAAEGFTRLGQFRHAVRLLTRAWQLRVEVKRARSRRAVS